MSGKGKNSSTKIPSWQVKGVDFETREAVKAAARRSGKTIGAWVNETLHKAATDELTGNNVPAQRLEDQLAAISDKLDSINRPFWDRIFKR